MFRIVFIWYFVIQRPSSIDDLHDRVHVGHIEFMSILIIKISQLSLQASHGKSLDFT